MAEAPSPFHTNLDGFAELGRSQGSLPTPSNKHTSRT